MTPLAKIYNLVHPTKDTMLAGISGLLLTAAFPKIGCNALAWVALVPLFFAIKDKPATASLKLGLFTGIVHFTTLLYWVTGVVESYGGLPASASWAVLLLLVMYLSLYTMAFTGILARLRQCSAINLWIAPVLWAGLEYIRAFLLTGFPWENLGYSQFKWLQLIQISDIFGVYGISAIIVAVNAALFDAVAKKTVSWRPMAITSLALIGVLAYGALRIAQMDQAIDKAPKRVVTLVQGNIDQSKKWIASFQNETIERYQRLTESALAKRPELNVWPETALPFYFTHDAKQTGRILRFIRRAHAYFLVGSPSSRWAGGKMGYFNSAYLVSPTGEVLDRYDKVHLVPYGEYVPLKRFFPFLGKVVEAVGDFEPGTTGHVLSWNHEKLGVLICFEVIFPELARTLAKKGAQLLINITNDAWFGTTSAPYQHFSMAVLRAVETRRTLARAANTGISGFIDPVGRVLDDTAIFKQAVRTRPVPMMKERTIYVRYGDFFAWACLAITCLCIGLTLRKRARN